MTSYIGLDASLQSTGVALVRDGQPPRVLTVKTKAPTVPTITARQERTDRIVTAAAEFIRLHADGDECRFAIEAPIFGNTRAGANGHVWDRAYLWWALVDRFSASGELSEVNVKFLKQFATNNGAAEKTAMGYRLGAEIAGIEGTINDDSVDALWLALMAQAHHDPASAPIVLHAYRVKALKSVAW